MTRNCSLFAGLFLAACVSPGTSVQSVGGSRLSVRLDSAYYWASPTPITGSDGNEEIVDVFPLVEALVVSRTDGGALASTDEALARDAANAHCSALSLGPPSSSSNFANGAWAFYPCTAAN